MHVIVMVAVSLFSVAAGSHVPHHEIHHHPQPYKFGYSVKDHHSEQHREESGDGHNVRGSYGFTDHRGVHRQVNYVADHAGFRAQVQTNEPGTANQNPAAVHMMSSAHNGQMEYGMDYGHHVPVTHGHHVPVTHGHHVTVTHGHHVPMTHGQPVPVTQGHHVPMVAVAAPVAVMGHMGQGYQYSAPLHGGHVSVYDSRHGMF